MKLVHRHVVKNLQKYADELGRICLFVIFFWFGFLKVLGVSPANNVVAELLGVMLPFLSTEYFIIFLGLFEMLLGVLMLIPRFTLVAVLILIVHMFTTLLPLVVLPDITWAGMLVPTLEGQYILKNLALVALAIGIVSHFKPLLRKLS